MAKKRLKKKKAKSPNKKAHKKAPKRAAKKKKKPAKRAGRPSKFKEEFVDLARGLARQGMNNKELARFLKVDPIQITRWRATNDEFDKAIREGKEEWDAGGVERTLIQKATKHDKVRDVLELRGRGKKKKLTQVKRYIDRDNVDMGAVKMVLQSRMPDKYGDKIKVEDVTPRKYTKKQLLDMLKEEKGETDAIAK